MKIINLLYRKYILSLVICVISTLTIFFIFSLIGNLNENYTFLVILKISILNSLQILSYVPAFIYLLSIILLSIFLRSKNEITVIKSYFSYRLLTIFILPIVFIFTFFEVSKSQLNLLIEDYKIQSINEDNQSRVKIFIKEDGNIKNYIVLKNFGQNDGSIPEYRSYYIYNDILETAEFSNKISYSKYSFFIEKFTQYKNNFIKDINAAKMIEINYLDLIQKNSIVYDISENNFFKFNIKLINLIIFFVLFFTCLFLYFFSSKFINVKQSLKNPIFISLFVLMYSFFVFHNSLSFYRQEFEIIASLIAGMFFIKVYSNE
tara:strand:- start:963 stop:1919 length:957 start_codon:yes stop_codon:yes gene_type:complete